MPGLAEVAREDPDLTPYVTLLELALAAAADGWPVHVADAGARLCAGQPVLHQAPLMLAKPRLLALHAALAAASTAPVMDGDLLPALRRALALEDADPILQLTLLPLLQASGRAVDDAVATAGWSSGVCPVCAAWPALAESRGLERSRVLRCGRCGAGWKLPWQLCPFCANSDHASLTYLVSDEIGEARRVFACDRCGGYLKTLATLAPIPPLAVPVEDLATLTLDLAALDAGRQRPTQPGFQIDVRLAWA